ncbi:hypothetical protein GE061_011000 [Apolygus lucorum]|uniref:Uncharacterized protein n=1 Tax=Apolygus lucorum TaxID=248454 RepID=A0A8S9XW43_APOLU|nr:hypothetical protein GE061_011000 [Apolygus lucorum]
MFRWRGGMHFLPVLEHPCYPGERELISFKLKFSLLVQVDCYCFCCTFQFFQSFPQFFSYSELFSHR